MFFKLHQSSRWPQHASRLQLLVAVSLVLAVGGAAAQSARAQSVWSPAASMSTVRSRQTATLLPNGKVLIAGGISLASAELYDPSANSWTSAGSMSTARSGHTATLLQNGKVLIAGGTDANGLYLASAELYDPATNTWTSAGSMSTVRSGHTATLLQNGKVLVAGGGDANGLYLASAELYDPATNTWSSAGSMSAARVYDTATLLQNGKVLVAGGGPSKPIFGSASAELYDPATNTWSSAASMSTARSFDTATLLKNGTVLVAGGYNIPFPLISSAELYNPATNSWSSAGSMSTGRSDDTATLLPDGRVLVAGGYTASAELYGPPLLGNAGIEKNVDSDTAGTAEAFATKVSYSGQMTRLDLYVDPGSTARQVSVGIYSDKNGHPGARQDQATYTNVTAGSWNAVQVPSLPVTAGQRVWVAVLGPSGAGTISFRDAPSGAGSETSARHNLTALPAQWQTGQTWPTGNLSAYGS